MQGSGDETRASILMVDDRPANLVAMEAVLESLGERLVKAASGEEALKHLLQEDFACILLDVQMPGMDGFETAALIKQHERTRHIPLLFITAISHEPSHVARGFGSGAVDYVVKPFDADILRAKVKVFVELHRRELRLRLRMARAEAERERRWLYRFLMQLPAIIAIHRGPEHVFEFSNALHSQLLGHRELLGRAVRQVMPELEGQGFFERLDQVYRTGETLVGTEMPAQVGPPGSPRLGYFNFIHQPIPGPDGRTDGVMVFGFEVTEQVLARQRVEGLAQQLRQSEAQLRALADSIPQLAWIAEADGSIHWYNRRWYEYTGTTPADMAAEGGWGWRQVHDPAELPRVLERYKASMASGEPWEDTFPLRRADGQLRAHLSRAMPVYDAEGRIVRWFGSNTDVEDHRQRAAELRDALQARDIFLSVASHELKTPLTPLALRLAQLRQSLGTAPSGQPPQSRDVRHLEIAETQVRKLRLLVDELLDVSRLLEGRLVLHPEDVDVTGLVRETVAVMESQAERAGSPLLLEPMGEISGHLDATRLAQVLTQLLSNAIKFGMGRPIHVGLAVDSGLIRLHVRDEGMGIPPDKLPRIFERFERGVSERHYGGLGLGLWVARRLVEAMGGTVSVQSTLEEGATFTVELPMGSSPAPGSRQGGEGSDGPAR